MDHSRFNRFVNQPLRELPLTPPLFIESATPVSRAIEAMRSAGSSCVLLGEQGQLEGIFTERDVVTKCMGEGFDWSQPVGAAVSTHAPRTIAAGRSLGEALAAFQQHGYRTLPVLDGDRVLGLVRLGDVLTHLAEEFPEELLNLPPRPHQVMEKQEGG
jgi:signal-transduction protein with cAMP-binding, CBS, and nucleotidyltransferase domain